MFLCKALSGLCWRCWVGQVGEPAYIVSKFWKLLNNILLIAIIARRRVIYRETALHIKGNQKQRTAETESSRKQKEEKVNGNDPSRTGVSRIAGEADICAGAAINGNIVKC